MLHRIVVSLFVLMFWAAAGASTVSYHTLTVDDGLPSNAALSVFKDHTGFIWIGTENGLSRFDGNTVVRYPGTASDEIWAIEELDDERLLYGTVSQLKIFNRTNNELTVIDLPPSYIKAIKKIGPDRALIGTDNGLYVLDGETTERVHLDSGISLANEITGITVHKGSGFWLSTADGLVHYNAAEKSSTVYRMPKTGEKTNYFTCLAVSGDKIYLGAFNQGLFTFDIPSHTFTEIDGFRHNLIQTVAVVGDKVYVGTNGRGLITYSLSTGSISSAVIDKNRNNSLKSNTITTFLYDKGIEWVGTQFGGLSYTPQSKDKFYILGEAGFNSADYRVTSFYRMPSGAKLLGTRDGLLYIGNNNRDVRHFTTRHPETGLRSDIITYIDRIGDNILVGTYGGGIHVFDPNTLTIRDLSDEDLFRHGCVFQFVADRNGHMWVATQEGLYHATLDGKVLHHYNHINSELPTSIVRRVMFDSQNRLWIGTKFGLVLLDTTSGKMAVDPLEIPGKDHIQNLYRSRNGNIFVCGTSGLSIVDPGLRVLSYIDKNTKLDGQRPMSVVETEGGAYWIVLSSGVYEYHVGDSTVRKYQKQDGLPSTMFNLNSGIIDDSTIYFTNEGGLVYTNLRDWNRKPKTGKKPLIVSCAYNDTVVDALTLGDRGSYVIPPDAETVRFNVTNMDFTLPYTNVYEYRLEGYDKEWRTLAGGYAIEYEDLPAGEYVLSVRNPGSAETASVNVVVRRSYVTIFITVALVLAVCVMILYFLLKIWRLQKRLLNERNIFASVKKSNEEPAEPKETEPADENPLLHSLLNYMGNERPYLDPQLSVGDVAAHLGTTDLELSRLLHSVMNVNWATFVNTYRVNEVKRCIERGDLSKLTLKALSEKCGFGSKTSFYRVFKKVVGMTPAEYCRQKGIQIGEQD